MTLVTIIATHNRPQLLLRCLKSLQAQGFEIEIHIANSGSPLPLEVYSFGVTVHQVGEDSHWAESMRFLYEIVAERPDIGNCILLNDDVTLGQGAVSELLRLSQLKPSAPIATGRMSDSSGAITYSGWRRGPWYWAPKLSRIDPEDETCDTMNGNFCLIAMETLRSIGGFPRGYKHSLADVVLGLRYRRSFGPIPISINPLGSCELNTEVPQYLNRKLSLNQRLKALFSKKGVPVGPQMRFYLEFGGFPGLVALPILYISILLSRNFRRGLEQ